MRFPNAANPKTTLQKDFACFRAAHLQHALHAAAMLLALAVATLPKYVEWFDEIIFTAVVFCTALQLGIVLTEMREGRLLITTFAVTMLKRFQDTVESSPRI